MIPASEDKRTMTSLKNPYDLYKLLQKSNCRQCYLPSCMAFAAAVIQGEKRLGDCPHLDPQTIAALGGAVTPRRNLEDDQEERAEELRQQVRELDLGGLAERLGGEFRDNRLCLRCLGKEFFLDRQGRISSGCHVNAWLRMELLRYVLHCQGAELRQEWLPLARLAGGQAVQPLFAKRCQEPLRRLADAQPGPFFDLVAMFGGRTTTEITGAGSARILRPLPHLPFALIHQPAEEGLESALQILFDRSAEQNATPEMIHFLGVGMAEMFARILHRHQE